MSAQTALQDDVLVDDFKQMIDEFASLHIHLSEIQRDYEAKKKRLAEAANAQPSKTKLTLEGYQFSLEFSDSAIKMVVPDNISNEFIFENYGLAAFAPSAKHIKEIEGARTREFGFTPSVLTTQWGSRRLLRAYKS